MTDGVAPVTWRGNCWSPEEDQIILAVVSREGPKWGRVVLRLPWRTVPSIRNRWQRMENGRKLRESGVESKNRCHACGEPRRGHVCLAKLSGSTSGFDPGLPSAYHTPAPNPTARLPAAGMNPHAMSPTSFSDSLATGTAVPTSTSEAGAVHDAPASSNAHTSLSGVSRGVSYGATLTRSAAASSHATSLSTTTDEGRCSSATGSAELLPAHFLHVSPPLRPSRSGEQGSSSAAPAHAVPATADGERGKSGVVGPCRNLDYDARAGLIGNLQMPCLRLGTAHGAPVSRPRACREPL